MAVVGLGGAGSNIAKKFMESLAPIDVIVIDADIDSLNSATADYKLPISNACENSECNNYSQSDLDKISKRLKNYDIVTMVAGMGGRTGTNVAPVIAEITDELNVLSMAIVVEPLSDENKDGISKTGVKNLKSVCSGTISIRNEKLRLKYPDLSVSEVFDKVNTEVEIFVRKKMKIASDLLMSEITKAMSSYSGKRKSSGTGRLDTIFA